MKVFYRHENEVLGTTYQRKLGARIKYFRIALHLSQKFMASCLFITTEEYANIEDGSRSVKDIELSKLCEIFGMSKTELIVERLSLINIAFVKTITKKAKRYLYYKPTKRRAIRGK